MLTNAYCVYDNKALIYGTPFYAPTDGSAVRSFRDLANDPNTTVGRHPGDFVLFHVGTFDDQNGQCLGVSPLRHVVDATALLAIQPRLPLTDPRMTMEERERFVAANGHAPE